MKGCQEWGDHLNANSTQAGLNIVFLTDYWIVCEFFACGSHPASSAIQLSFSFN